MATNYEHGPGCTLGDNGQQCRECAQRYPSSKKKDQTVERERGETYHRGTFAIYEHGVYPRHSVLAGQPRRVFVEGGFKTVEDAQAKHPHARYIAGTTHRSVNSMTAHLPDDDVEEDFDPYDN